MSKIPHSKILLVNALADYQDEAIVSRILIQSNSGSVTLFAFAQNQELSEHTAPFDALVYVTEGIIRIRISNQPYTLQTGETLLMPAGKPHALKAVENSKMLLIMLRA